MIFLMGQLFCASKGYAEIMGKRGRIAMVILCIIMTGLNALNKYVHIPYLLCIGLSIGLLLVIYLVVLSY